MLTIRREQMEAMGNGKRRPFVLRVAKRLRRRYPYETAKVTDEELESAIEVGIDKAEGYSIVRQADVARFIEILYGRSGKMKEKKLGKEALSILEDDRFSGEEKLDLITAQLACEFQRHASREPAA